MKIETLDNYLRVARDMIYDGEVDEALKLMRELLYEEPGYYGLHNHLGWALMYYGDDVQNAERHLLMAVKFNANYGPAYLHLGNLYIRMRRYSDAVNMLHQGLTKPDIYAAAYYEALAEAFELLRKYGKAVENYKLAMVNTVGEDAERFIRRIKACRKKRLVMMML